MKLLKISFKHSEEYKIIKKRLTILLGYPDYIDEIVNGVSFKWYHQTYKISTTAIFRKHLEENIRELLEEIFEDFNVTFKMIPNQAGGGRYLYSSKRSTGPILRILVKRK